MSIHEFDSSSLYYGTHMLVVKQVIFSTSHRFNYYLPFLIAPVVRNRYVLESYEPHEYNNAGNIK